MTLYSSVLASPSRLKLAHESDLDSSQESYHYAAGRYATVATLAAAHELGMKYSVETTTTSDYEWRCLLDHIACAEVSPCSRLQLG
jgi:hypothetical protein